MLEQPETRYARTGDVHIAYQVVGDGPIDIVLFGTFVSHVELIWDDPQAADLLRRLASFSRLIIFDKRGVGMSDPMPPNAPPTLEERLEDVRAVMDAAGSQEAVLLANSEGGQLAVLFATIYPERTRSIVFFGAFAALRRRDDYPIGVPAHVLDRTIEFIGEHHGETGYLDLVLPSVADDQRREAWWAGFFRRSTSPGAAATQVRMNRDADVRHLLPLVQVPALVLHAEGDRWIRPEMGRYLAENIPEARFVSLPGGDHLPYAELGPRVADEVQEFITGSRAPVEPDGVLATVLFTDISSGRRNGRRSRATTTGRTWSRATTVTYGDRSNATAGGGPAPPVTASSRCSTARPARSAARSRSTGPSVRTGSRCASVSTPARSSCAVTTSPGSRCTSGRGSRPRRTPVRCSCPGRSRRSSSAPASSWRTADIKD